MILALSGLRAQGVGKLVVAFAGPRFADATFHRGVRAQEVRSPLDSYVVFFRQFVDAFQADIAPGSNIVVPDDYVDRVGVSRMVVRWRWGRHKASPMV